ncbi:hypothetical protein EMIHUDRAFT_250819 [Emiliania huxleyi CCMP1516]|uniref:Apple domain-containing protein n=2 Tax=Emiliania huxleyi TaxID=2903 RepID=A0A0D3HXR8_EMIH1|nr:hypothetical protein EMIHUDRAFT_250819 [Emiliania huxleyi CCMP1516]EOD03803.1 hypothetical protein EMIHUDRAFT_250819 [Emiliania huxleyi CCMP1516]|eukprot:XP_005756232.1 hypothetical protein EMIHUDRAFT_250819 [Emiliania huxleyi CCMP1516]
MTSENRAGGPGKFDTASTSNSLSYAENHATCRRSCDVDALCVGYSFYAPLRYGGQKLDGTVRTGYETVAPVVKELEKELGALLPERWAQKVDEHGSAVREWSLRPLGDSLKLNLDDRNRTSTPSALPPLLRDLAKARLGQTILASSPLKLALGVAVWLFLALCFYRCCCRRRKPPHKRLVVLEPDEEEARGGKPSRRRSKRPSDAMPFLPSNRSAAELELAEQVADLERRLAVSKATELAEQVAELERRLAVSKATRPEV